MSQPGLSHYERARRYTLLLGSTALLPAAALLVFGLVNQSADNEQHQRLTLYHLETQSLAREATVYLSRIAASGPQAPYQDSLGTSPGAEEFMLTGSIVQILQLQEERGHPRYAVLIERLRRAWMEMLANRSGEVATPDASAEVYLRLTLALEQIERLHEYESDAAIDELRFGTGRRIGILAVFGIVVLGLTGVIAFRIMVLIREALARQEALERQVRQGYERDAHAQRVEALGRLVGGVAHDFNNLLTGIIGHAELLERELEPGSQQVDDARHVLDSAFRAAAITRQLLTYSRQGSAATEVLEPNRVLLESEVLIREMMGPRITLELRLGSEVGSVLADRTQLQQVITNLCTNARDAMSEGGRLVISTHNEVTSPKSGHVAIPGEAFTVITVTDSGSGIHWSIHPVIFDPFFTTKPDGKGTGLGLSMVHGFVDTAGGHVEVQSEPGKGTSFFVYLPQTQLNVSEPSRATKETGLGEHRLALLGGSERVLVVDDEPSVRTFIRDALESHGYHVWTAANGPEGLELCRAHRGEIDLIVTDIVMPGMDGPELVRAAEAFLDGCPVVFVSGYLSDHAFLESLTRAGHLLLRKPFKLSELLAMVRYALGDSSSSDPTEARWRGRLARSGGGAPER